MNLTTHAAIGFAIGLAVFRSIDLALVMMMGALIPDLDREYLFIAKDKMAQYQLHRALFHNFFFLGFLYVLNPVFALGAFSHVVLDMSTSATDRGAEILFPLTRLVKGFQWDIEGTEQPADKKVKWWVEDPWRLLKDTSDRDLSEPGVQPWGRMYGPFKNSRIADWSFFFGSIIFVILLYATGGPSYFSTTGLQSTIIIPLIGTFIFYGLGELWRAKLSDTHAQSRVRYLVLAILVIGLVLFIAGMFYLFSPTQTAVNVWFYVENGTVAGTIGLIVAYLFVRLRDKQAITV